MAILSHETLQDGLTAHIAASLQLDMENPEEVEGVSQIAAAALDYFKSSFKGAPVGGSQIILWTIFSALWENKVPQERIDEFFQNVNMDVGRIFSAWSQFSPEERQSPVTVALIPGNISEADIYNVTAALFNNAKK